MISIEKTGKTVEEALRLALKELNVSEEEVTVEILDEGNKGLLGILGNKEACIRVTKKVDISADIYKYLEELFKKMKLDVDIEVMERDDHFYCNIRGENAGILIGRRGETLDSMQYITSLAIQRIIGERVRIVLDIENYRKKREDTLIRLAYRLSEKAKSKQQKIYLEPMTPQERRIVHATLQNDTEVETVSEGNEPYRKVVIIPKQ